MLEPVVRPRTGQALNVLGALLAIGAIFLNAVVTTAAGDIPSILVMPVFALVFLLRFAGITAGEWRGLKEMPWGYRVASWGALALGLLVLGLLFSRGGAIFLFAIVALDAAGALSRRRPGERTREGDGRLVAWARRRAVGLGLLWAGGLVALHLLYAAHVPHGALVDWTYLAIGFALLVRFGAVGERVPDAAARPPPAHRVHVKRDEAVPDPVTRQADLACETFLRDGDAGPLLEVVRSASRHAHLDAPAARALEERVLAALARAGTSRAEDLEAAVVALERGLEGLAPTRRSFRSDPS